MVQTGLIMLDFLKLSQFAHICPDEFRVVTSQQEEHNQREHCIEMQRV